MKDGKGTYRCGADGAWEDILTLSRDLPVCVPDCALKRDTASSRIIGGRNAQLGQFPWQAHITTEDSRGAGVLLHDKWIITTARLLQEVDLSQVVIKLGTTSLREENYIQGEPGEVFIHKDYGNGTIDNDNDIGLIKLKNKIPIGENVQGICLPTKEAHFHISHRESDHHVGIVAGFGQTEMSRISSRLLFVEVDVVEQQTCREAYQKRYDRVVSENMICAGHAEGGRDTCTGDAGTALAFLDAKTNKWFIGGIASWGSNCGDKHYPGVYTRVSNYLDWIENIIKNN
ncbi:mannan-binding lectin serine protease 2-like [Anomaloglossus baeobatrachus]|uniref:mannan-binding lectin serine protease 2-like n=1 Tax=Anomaloglossus baeobatrachus TaxID=238106 RepID=UPI003F5000B7